MTDYISFPSNGNFYRQNKNFVLSLPTNETAAMKIFKKSFGDCISETGSKMPRNLESKSSGAFNSIEIVALNLCTNSHNLFMKITQHVTSQMKLQR